MSKRALATLFAFGTLAILVGINLTLLFSQSIRLDESQSLWVSTKPAATVLQLTAENVHVPLYHLLLHVWVQLFGSTAVVARLLSFLFFLATLPVLFHVAKSVGTARMGFLTVVLFALSPFVNWYASEARMYTLFAFVTSLNHLFYVQLIRSRGRQGRLGYIGSSIAGLYTHYFFLLLMMAQAVHSVIYIWRHTSGTHERLRQLLHIAGLMTAALVTLAPWVFWVLRLGSAAYAQPLIPTPSSFNVLQIFAQFVFGFQTHLFQALLVSLWPLLAAMLFIVFSRKKGAPGAHMDYFFLVTFLPVVVAFLLSFFKPIFLARYLMFVVPTTFILVSWVLMHLQRQLSSVVAGGLFLLMAGLSLVQTVSAATPVKEDYRAIASYITDHAVASDIIAVSAPFTVYPVEYYYRGLVRITTIPEWNRFVEGPIPPFTVENVTRHIDQLRRHHARLFLVLSYDQGYEQELRTQLDTTLELLETRTFTEGIELRIYRLNYDREIVSQD